MKKYLGYTCLITVLSLCFFSCKENTIINPVPDQQVQKVKLKVYGPVRIWETTGTTINQPSGLDLSAGAAYGLNSSNVNKIDIYYSSSGFKLNSAGNINNRHSYFYIGNSSDLFDLTASPLASGGWASSVDDRESKYFFIFDSDDHYTKMKIVNYGGGLPGMPAWVEVQWIYSNKTNYRGFGSSSVRNEFDINNN